MRPVLLLCVLALGCGKGKSALEIAGELRAAATSAIQKGSLEEAQQAIDKLIAHQKQHPQLGSSEDLILRLAERYAEAWSLDTIATKSSRFFEAYRNANHSCSRVHSDTKWRDPAALAAIADQLAKARDLFRRGCDYWRAAETSALLNDLEAVEADLVAAHQPPCKPSTTYSPQTYRAQLAIELAQSRGDPAATKRLAQAALARAKGYPGAAIDACRARVVLGYFAEQELAFSDAREHYKQVGAKENSSHEWAGPEGADPCYPTAAARLASLATARDQWALPRTTIFGSVKSPPETVVRVAFQAHPAVPKGTQPAAYGNGTQPDLRHPWPERTIFWIDAEIDPDGRLIARLPPGHWMPQVEIEPAGKWHLADTICFPPIDVKGTTGEVLPELPKIEFVERS